MISSWFSKTLISRLASAERVAVLTGAGISAESGIPTFRDPGGLWQQFKPEELANVHAFLNNPALVQGWYAYRRSIALEKKPNPGHEALAALEALVPSFTLITQNVDDLHRRAGSRNIVELHGNLMRSYCIDCQKPSLNEMPASASDEPVRCDACGGLIRPDIVWFGEYLPEGAMEAAHRAAQEADVFLSIGTSAVVYPAAGIPITAKEHGAYVVEVNVESSAIADYMDEVVLGRAGEVLPRLAANVQESRAVSIT
jgi:NAD-dependent deacetylase